MTTEQIIKDALLELMDAVGLDKVTVNDLAKKAHINRGTFYLHYLDKYDLLDRLENEMLDSMKELMKNMPVHIITTKGFDDVMVAETLRNILIYIKENSTFYTIMLSKNGSSSFLNKLHNTIRNVVLEKGLILNPNIPEKYMIAIISAIQTSIIREWLTTGMKESPEQLAALVSGIFKDVPKILFALSHK